MPWRLARGLSSNLSLKLRIGIVLTVCVVIGTFDYLDACGIHEEVRSETRAAGDAIALATAASTAEYFLAYDYPVIQSLLERLVSRSPLVRVASVVRSDGQTVAAAGKERAGLEPIRTPIEGPPEQEGGAPSVLGHVHLGLSLQRAELAAEEGVRAVLWRSLSIVAILTFALALVAQRWLTRPIDRLREQGERLSEGDLDTAIVPVSEDELGQLSACLEEMRIKLRASLQGLEAQNQELQRLDQMKSDFVATMSHEIRTPLNGILGFLTLLLDSDLEESQQTMLTRASRAGDSLLGIINDILDFSKIESGHVEVDAVATDLRMVLRDVVDLVEPGGAAKGIAVLSSVAPKFPTQVMADAARVRQILLNLLSNAIKFTSSGSVTVRLGLSDPGENRQVFLTVQDTGIGMSEHQASLVFEAFRQADASVNRRFGGTGLGLSISKELAGILGGDLTVRSIEGVGSTFTLSLPFRPVDEKAEVVAASTETVASERAYRKAERVLLVDDNAINREVGRRLIERLDVEVEIEDGGQASVDRFTMKGEQFDLIFMDCHMPEVDGFAATRALRAAGCDWPIIALTASADQETRRLATEAGMTGFMTKPIRQPDLEEALKIEIEAPRAEGQLPLPT